LQQKSATILTNIAGIYNEKYLEFKIPIKMKPTSDKIFLEVWNLIQRKTGSYLCGFSWHCAVEKEGTKEFFPGAEVDRRLAGSG
jgi:hypothetical protein